MPIHPLIAAMPPGTWIEAPLSRMASVGFAWPAGSQTGAQGLNGAISQNGAAFDAGRDRLVIGCAGGHYHYAGNEVYVFSLATLQWQRLNDPCLQTDPMGVYLDSDCYPDAAGIPDPHQPRSCHTANSLAHVPALDKLVLFGMTATFAQNGGHTNSKVWAFDYQALQWTLQAQRAPAYGWAASDYDPATGLWWVRGTRPGTGGHYLASWEPMTDTWTLRSGPVWQGQQIQGALDRQRQQFVTFLKGSPSVLVHQLTAAGLIPEVAQLTTGDTAILTQTTTALWSPGCVYVPTRDCFVAWSGRPELGLRCEDVYELNPTTWVWTRIPPAPGNTVVPSAAHPAGTYSHWRWSPASGVFVLVNSANENVWLYKPAWSVPAAPVLRGALTVRVE